jgi:protein-L-isoaspartate(D-aspartate) O-methyltransferase
MKRFYIEQMVEEIDKEFPISDKIKKAFYKVDRELFVHQGFKHLSYKLDALPMQEQQWISSPLTVAKMTHYLELEGADSVLEIGCGSGYQAAILAQLVRRVFTIERIESLLYEAKDRFRMLGFSNIFTRHDDGQRGWKEFAPFDRILFSATLQREVPKAIVEQLSEDGIIVAPVYQNDGSQKLMRYRKKNGILVSEMLESCRFVPIKDGIQK